MISVCENTRTYSARFATVAGLYGSPNRIRIVLVNRSIRDMHDEILSVGLRVIGISPQDGISHLKFKKQHNLPFTLLSDPGKVAIKMYDVDGPFGVGVRRATYLITQGAKIQSALQADVMIRRHADFIEKAVMLREAAGMKARDAEQKHEGSDD